MDTPPFPTWVDAFDTRVDNWFDRIRRPALDPVFYGISSAADHSILWLSISALRALLDRDPAVALRISGVIAAESALTNGPIKMMFRRVRPDRDLSEPPPYGMRIPITSSFPSGHATAAFTAAMVLTRRPREAWFWFPLAGLVASSRVYVKMHHASDVVAGAALGLALGAIGRRVVRHRAR
ncbi:MAG: phosphatase PAP2 family protein [Acidimicrobiia bacterium]